MATLKTRLILRNDITDNWKGATGLKLLKGEVGVEWYGVTDQNAGKPKLKIGDGETTWDKLPYIQDSLINIIVGTVEDGNTIVGATTNYDDATGVYNLTLERGNRLADIAVADDKVVILTKQPDDWNEKPTITASHVEAYPGGYKGKDSTNTTINPMSGGVFKVEKSTVDKYGHTSAITQQDITIEGHNITINQNVKPLEAVEGTVNVLTDLTADNHTITRLYTNVYTKDKIDNLINPGMEFIGVLNLDSGLASLPTDAKKGNSYKIGSVQSNAVGKVKIGDLIIAQKDNPQQLFSKDDWAVIPSGDDVEDTWRPIKVDETEFLGTGIDTGKITFKSGRGINLGAENGVITVAYTGATTDTIYEGVKPIIITTENGKNKISHAAPTPVTTSEFVKISCDGTGHINHKVDVATDDITKFFGNGTLITKGNAEGKIVFNHNNSGVTAQSYGQSKDQDFPAVGGTISVPYITVDAAGHITAAADHTVTLPTTAYDHSYGEINVINNDTIDAVTGSKGQIKASNGTSDHNFTLATGNKWLQINASDTANGKDIITLGHALGHLYKHDKTTHQTFTWDTLTAFDLDKIVSDEGGHIIEGTEPIKITLPNTAVTAKMKGLAPKSSTDSLLLNKYNGDAPIWDSVLTLDGGSASTFSNKAAADAATGENVDKTNYYGRIF